MMMHDFTFMVGMVAVLVIAAVYISVVQYKKIGAKAALIRGIVYVLLVGTLAGIYFSLSFTVYKIALHKNISATFHSEAIDIILAMILAFLFQPIKRFFDEHTDKLFYRNECNREDFIQGLSAILTQTTDLQLLIRRISSYSMRELKMEKVTFCIPGKGVYGWGGRRRRTVVEADVQSIMRYYKKYHIFPEAIVARYSKDDTIKTLFKLHKTDVALPLIHQDQELGIVFFRNGEDRTCSARTIRIIESVASELAIAIQNALSVEEVRRLNETLQRKIDESTKELRATNRQLQRLDESKNEFISMASHQLRTPLTSIKGYLDMMLEGDLGKISPTQRAVLREAFSSSERMVRLINDFLSVSRLQTGKFVIDRRKSDLSQIIQEEIALLDVVARQRSIKLKITIHKNIPELNIDAEKIRQVVLNMVDNAIYYSKPNRVVEVRLRNVGSSVEFTVKDSGIGIPKNEQANLFGKFFRGSNARKKRPDGTGVGLFLARKVILFHGGEVIFSSEEGKGSTFGFTLPLDTSDLKQTKHAGKNHGQYKADKK